MNLPHRILLFHVFLFVVLSQSGIGQIGPIWIDRDWDHVPDSIHAHYYRMITVLNDSTVEINDHFIDGTLQMNGKYVTHGAFPDWDTPEGVLAIENKIGFEKRGLFTYYNADGSEKSSTDYDAQKTAVPFQPTVTGFISSGDLSVNVRHATSWPPSKKEVLIFLESPDIPFLDQIETPKELNGMTDSIFWKKSDLPEYLSYAIEFSGNYKDGRIAIRQFHPDGTPKNFMYYQLEYVRDDYSSQEEDAELISLVKANRTDSNLIWNEEGQLVEKVFFKDDRQHGPALKWFDNGQPQTEAHFENGKLDGDFRSWWENGNPERVATYRFGNVLANSYKTWYENGNPEQLISFNVDSTVRYLEQFHENGQLEYKVVLKEEDKPKGEFKRYNDEGILIMASTIKDDNVEGPVLLYYDDGTHKSEINYKYGKPIDLATYWHPNGNVKARGNFEQEFVKRSTSTRYSVTMTIEGGETVTTSKPEEESEDFKMVIKSKKTGKWEYFDTHGKVEKTEVYEDGEAVKEKFHTKAKELESDHCYRDVEIKLDDGTLVYICVDRAIEIEQFADTVNAKGDSIRFRVAVADIHSTRGDLTYSQFLPNGTKVFQGEFGPTFSRPGQRRTSRMGCARFSPWKWWNEDGVLIREETYFGHSAGWNEEDIQILKTYYDSGKPATEEQRNDPQSTDGPKRGFHLLKAWYPNGQLKTEELQDPKTERTTFKKWNENGTLVLHYQYDRLGDKDGVQILYNHEGELLSKRKFSEGKQIK